MTTTADLTSDLIDLYARYADCLDSETYDDWVELFTEDCVYRVLPRENHDRGLPLSTMWLKGKGGLRDRIYGIRETLYHAPYYQRHVIGPARVTGRDGDGWTVEANYLVIRTKRDEPSEVFNAGRYIDRVVRGDEGLLFDRKLCVYDSELILNSMIYPV